MKTLMRPITALCTLFLLAMALPAAAQIPSLQTADREVCCSGTDAAGNRIFFLAPRSQCPRNQVVAPERCKKQTGDAVCCKTPNGFFKVGSARRCKAAGGSIAPNRYCKKDDKSVCCKTPNGTANMPSRRCKAAGGTPVNPRYCRPNNRRVCCETANGYAMIPARRCRPPAGSPVNPKYCRHQSGQKRCCKTPNGYYEWTAAQCKRARGTLVNPRYCRNQPADKICCKFTGANGNVVHGMLSPKVCKAYKGTKVSNRYCLKATDNLKLRRLDRNR